MTAPWFDVRDYGAVCNGVNDDTTAIQAAIAAAQSAGADTVHLYGSMKISASLVITANLRVIGDGLNNTWLLPTNSTFDAIFYNPANGVTLAQGVNMEKAYNATVALEGFSIQYPSVQNASSFAIRMQAQNNLCITQPVIRDIAIINASNGILASDVLGGVIERNTIMNFYGDGIKVSSPNSPDGGGLIIKANSIVNYQSYSDGVASGRAIHHTSGGGLKILKNNIAVVYDGIYVNLDGSSTQLIIEGNSFDTATNTGVWISRASTGVAFAAVVITGNTFAAPVALYVAPDSGAGTPWLSNLLFVANSILGASGQNSSHVYIDAVHGFQVSNNAFVSNSSAPTALNIATHAANGILGPNIKIGSYAANNLLGSSLTTISPT